MERIICIAILVLYGVVMLLMCSLQYYTVFKNNEKPKNKVHFYVARDMDGVLFLYIGKPVRTINEFLACNYGKAITSSKYFSKYGLNENDYDNLKWEDEPVEIFLNMEN